MRYRCGRKAGAVSGQGNRATAYEELMRLLKSPSVRVRRMAAATLERLAWLGVDVSVAAADLQIAVREEADDRTRYHVASALQSYQARQASSRRREVSVSSKPKVSRVSTPS